MSEDVLRLLAAADELPSVTDAPEDADSTVAYDVGLQADLEEHGPDALKEWGRITVRDVAPAERWNSALWYAMKWGLNHDRVGDDLVLTDPQAE